MFTCMDMYVGTVWVLVSFFSNRPRLGDFSLLGLVVPGLAVRLWFTCYLSGSDDDDDDDHDNMMGEREREKEIESLVFSIPCRFSSNVLRDRTIGTENASTYPSTHVSTHPVVVVVLWHLSHWRVRSTTSRTFSMPNSYRRCLPPFSTYKAFSMAALRAGGLAPTTSPTLWPFLKSKKVGMARTANSCATSGSSSTSIL